MMWISAGEECSRQREGQVQRCWRKDELGKL